jgi:hypothetical protein
LADALPTSVEPARLTAWKALSDLFLDTRLEEADIAAIAMQLRSTGFSLRELERIYEDEVAPVCWRNLSALPGGVWSGFSTAWLVDAIQREQHRGRWWTRVPWVKRLQVNRWTRDSRDEWARVKRHLSNGSSASASAE